MNKSKTRFILLLLCICMCIGLMPASAVKTDSEVDTSGIYHIKAGDAYPAGFDKGLVYKYTAPDTDGIAKIDVSIYKPNSIGAFCLMISKLMWRHSDVYLTDSAGSKNLDNTGRETTGFVSAKVTHPELLDEYAEEDCGTTVESNIMGKLFDYSDVRAAAAGDDGYARLNLEINSYRAASNGFITQDGKGVLIDSSIDELSLFTMYFKVRDGKSVTDETFGLGFYGAAGLEKGTVFKNTNDDDLCKSTLFIGFPEGAEKTYNYSFTAKLSEDGKAGEDPTVTITSDKGFSVDCESCEFDAQTGLLSVDFSITTVGSPSNAGTYSIKISKNKCTYFLLKDIPVGAGIKMIDLEERFGTINLYCGDANGDGYISASDDLIIDVNYNKNTDKGDLNGDGHIDISDYLILKRNYGKEPVIQSWNQPVS